MRLLPAISLARPGAALGAEVAEQPAMARGEARLPPLARATLAAILAGVVAATVAHLQGPTSSSPVGPLEFSVPRAAAHVEALAAQSRAIGTAGHGRARAYIAEQLRRAGLAPETQTATGVHRVGLDGLESVRVQNVLARIGTAGGPAVLLLAHYDSVPFGPGAGDNAAAVASLLEAARVLASGPPMRHDVIVALTDGEEAYQDGVRAFVDRHPWAKNVDVALNFDARGNRGAVLMFETGTGNRAAVAALARTASAPLASSVFPEIYRLMPNTTDFTPLKSAGIGGLNFANIAGARAYHSPTDRPEQLDSAVLQHQGRYAVAVTRELANGALPLDRRTDAAYFDLVGRWLIVMPIGWMPPLAAAMAAGFVAAIAWTIRRRRVSVRRLLAGVGAVPLAALAVSLVMRAALSSGVLTGGDDPTLAAALLIVPAAALLAVDGTAFRRLSSAEATLANLVWLLASGVATSVVLPGAAYFFLIPLGAATAAVVFSERWPHAPALVRVVVLGATSVATLVLTLPVLMLIIGGLTVRAAGPVLVCGVVVAGAMLPVLRAIAAPRRRTGAVALAACAVALIAVRTAAAEPTGRFDHLAYILDVDRGRAVWASLDAAPDEWTGSFVRPAAVEPSIGLPWVRDRPWLEGAAPAASVGAPVATRVSDAVLDGRRSTTLHVASARQAGVIWIRFDDSASQAAIDGEVIASPGGPWHIELRNVPPEGAAVVVESAAGRTFHVTLFDLTYGLDLVPGLPPVRRPPGLLPRPTSMTDAVVVARSFTF